VAIECSSTNFGKRIPQLYTSIGVPEKVGGDIRGRTKKKKNKRGMITETYPTAK
jgi:hypothetical protein